MHTYWGNSCWLEGFRRDNQISKEVCIHFSPNSRLTGNICRQSIDVHIAHQIPDRMPDSPHSVHDTEHIVTPQYRHDTTSTSKVATELHPLQQPERVPVDVRWDQSTIQDVQNDAARYVPNTNVNPYGGSTPCQSNPNWQTFPGAANAQSHFNPEFGQNTAMEQPRSQFSIESVPYTSPMDIAFHSP